jgi:hypothetical protein
MSRNVSWDIQTYEFGTLTASGVIADSQPTITAGEELSLTLYFDESLSNHESNYEDIREFVRLTNDSTIDTGTDIRGKPWYREKLHPEATWPTALVKLKPAADVGDVEDWWAVIVGGEDETRFVGTGERITLDVFILGKSTTYSTRTDVENDIKADL